MFYFYLIYSYTMLNTEIYSIIHLKSKLYKNIKKIE